MNFVVANCLDSLLENPFWNPEHLGLRIPRPLRCHSYGMTMRFVTHKKVQMSRWTWNSSLVMCQIIRTSWTPRKLCYISVDRFFIQSSCLYITKINYILHIYQINVSRVTQINRHLATGVIWKNRFTHFKPIFHFYRP